MSHFSLQARWVLPIDQPPLAGGVVTIADGRVVAVGTGCSTAGPLEDLGDVALLPGLVNAHTHLEFSQAEGPLGEPGMPLPEWIRLVIADRRRTGRDTNEAIRAGLSESLNAGVTTVGDIATQAYDVGDTAPLVTVFQEVIGFSAARIESVLAEVRHCLSDQPCPALGISPHAPYTVNPKLLARLVDLAIDQQLPVAMHLAESREELQLLATCAGPFAELLNERSMWDPAAIPRGSTPLNYLEVLARAPSALVIHGNYLSKAEIQFLAEHRQRMSLVYCPRTHAYFGHDPYPLKQLLAAGVRVALGTDSRASSPNLSVLAELCFAARQHPAVAPAKILELGTLAGAEALGRADDAGTITPGKRADLVAIACKGKTIDPIEEVLREEGAVVAAWLGGTRIAV